MRILFMGSAEIACPSLKSLIAESRFNVVGVVTQPDRPKGRRLQLAACAVKETLSGLDIPVISPENINQPNVLDVLRSWKPDLVVVAAYGQILRSDVLSIAPQGCINVHTSLLPLYRGAAPIQWAVANGDAETGITIMYMDEGMDTGDIISQRRIRIGEQETAGMLHDRLGEVGANLLCETIRDLQSGSAVRTPQDPLLASYAPKLAKCDGKIDWTTSASAIYNRIRGFNPWPCCFCTLPNAKKSVLRVKAGRCEGGCGQPGEVISIKGDGPLVACGEGALRLLEVQPEGKRVMEGCSYLCGHALALGDVLD